jgi:hypothetical protein
MKVGKSVAVGPAFGNAVSRIKWDIIINFKRLFR